MRKVLLGAITLFAGVGLLKAQDLVVAKDGSGHYSTVQAAFNAVPTNSSVRTVIYIKNGTYKEVLELPSNRPNVTVIGESNTGVVLTNDNYSTKINPATGATYGTSGSASTFIKAAGFYAWNVTFANSAGEVGPALAIHVSGDKAVFRNCRFLGNQDTFFGGNCRQYFTDCYFEGTTDFIFGPSTAFFEKCTIHSKGGSAITAASTESYVSYGYVFNNCKVTGASGVSTVLGRTWRPYAATAFINSNLSSAVKAEGWSDWGNASNQTTARYREYNNTGAGASLSGRVSWIKMLSASEASKYSALNVLKTTYASTPVTDNWNPLTVINSTSLFMEGDGFGVNTGGNSGPQVIVSTPSELIAYAESVKPYRIIIDGTIDMGTRKVNLTSYKTIEGANDRSKLIGNLNCTNGNGHIIIKNLTITNPYGDGVTIWNAHHVFVNHVTFVDCADGSCDINNGSDFVTVSWCKFYYVNQTKHKYVMILGGDPYDAPGDKLHVTIHHNWLAEGCDQRMPSGSYSNAHLYNNYFSSAGNSYCTNARIGTNWLAENNYYDGVKNPCYYQDGGKITMIGNVFNNCTGTISEGTVSSLQPSYPYSLTPANDVPEVVMVGAGNVIKGNATLNGSFSILASHSGKALDVYAWGTSNGTNICQWSPWGGATQKFTITAVDGEWHRITPALATDKALDVANASTSSGANIQLWSYWGGSGQQFRFQNAGAGIYRIIARHSGKCLDVASASMADGANVQQWNCSEGSRHQMFSLMNLKSAQLDIDEKPLPLELDVFPNPVKDKLNVVIPSCMDGFASLTLINGFGHVLYEQMAMPEGKHPINMEQCAAGVYLLKIEGNGKTLIRKIIKQ
jgi:pectinesterase